MLKFGTKNESYEIPILNKITLLQGLSGSGKTTLLYLLQDSIRQRDGYFLESVVQPVIMTEELFETIPNNDPFRLYIVDEYISVSNYSNIINKSNSLFIIINREKLRIPTNTASVFEFAYNNGKHSLLRVDRNLRRSIQLDGSVPTYTEDEKSSRLFLNEYLPHLNAGTFKGIPKLSKFLRDIYSQGIKEVNIIFDAFGAGMFISDIVRTVNLCKTMQVNFTDWNSFEFYILSSNNFSTIKTTLNNIEDEVNVYSKEDICTKLLFNCIHYRKDHLNQCLQMDIQCSQCYRYIKNQCFYPCYTSHFDNYIHSYLRKGDT